MFGVQARVRVERHADGRDIDAEHTLAVLLDRGDQLLLSGQRRERAGKQQAANLDADAVVAGDRALDQRAHARLHLGRILLGNHPAIHFQREPVGDDVGVDAAVEHADDHRRMVDARDPRLLRLQGVGFRVDRIQDRGARSKRVAARLGHRAVARLAVDGDFELQAPLCAVTTA